MEMFSKPVRLSPEMARLLDNMRSASEPYPVYNQPAAEADEKVFVVARSLLTDAGLVRLSIVQYMWYVRELARLLRTRTGRDLAFHLELTIRKWQTFGLSPNVLQILACEIHNAPEAGRGGRADSWQPERDAEGEVTTMTQGHQRAV